MKTERHGFKFTNKKNTKGGIIAIIFGVAALCFLIAGIYVSYSKHGNAGTIAGLLGAASFWIAMMGFIEGLLSFREKDRFFNCSYIGTILCGMIWIIMAVIIGYGIAA